VDEAFHEVLAFLEFWINKNISVAGKLQASFYCVRFSIFLNRKSGIFHFINRISADKTVIFTNRIIKGYGDSDYSFLD